MEPLARLDAQLTDWIRDTVPDYEDALAACAQPLTDAAGEPTEQSVAWRARVAARIAETEAAWETSGGDRRLLDRLAALGILEPR